MRLFSKLIFGVLFVATAGAAQAGSGDVSPADAKAMHDYPLSMTKIMAMQGAMDDAKQLEKTNPAFAKKMSDDTDDSKNLTQLEATLNAYPPLMAIYRKHGLTAADAVLMPLTLMSASVAAQYPSAADKLSAQTSPQQIAFIKAHGAELKKMSWLYGSGQ